MEKMRFYPQIIIYSVVFVSQCDIQQVLFQRLHSVISIAQPRWRPRWYYHGKGTVPKNKKRVKFRTFPIHERGGGLPDSGRGDDYEGSGPGAMVMVMLYHGRICIHHFFLSCPILLHCCFSEMIVNVWNDNNDFGWQFWCLLEILVLATIVLCKNLKLVWNYHNCFGQASAICLEW